LTFKDVTISEINRRNSHTQEDKMDHDLKDFLKLHARDGAATGPLCARALKRIEVLEAALTPFALFSQRAKGDDEAVLRRSDFDHARVALTGHLSGE
jgi:hypothetical protein